MPAWAHCPYEPQGQILHQQGLKHLLCLGLTRSGRNLPDDVRPIPFQRGRGSPHVARILKPVSRRNQVRHCRLPQHVPAVLQECSLEKRISAARAGMNVRNLKVDRCPGRCRVFSSRFGLQRGGRHVLRCGQRGILHRRHGRLRPRRVCLRYRHHQAAQATSQSNDFKPDRTLHFMASIASTSWI